MTAPASAHLGYLGPAGTFTEAALRTLPLAAHAQLLTTRCAADVSRAWR